jgi:hypothetical protein
MAALRAGGWRGRAETAISHPTPGSSGAQVIDDWKESFDMTALTKSFGQFQAALGVVGSAISLAAALRITHPAGQRPEGPARD